MEYDNWGCEFLDLREFSAPSKIVYPGARLLKVDLVERMLDHKYISERERFHAEYLDRLLFLIKTQGLLYPGTVVLNKTKIKLQDGNNRFICCKRLGYEYFPVWVTYSDGVIKSGGLSLQELAGEIL